MAGFRKKKLEELVKRIIGDALLKEIKDPRLGFVSVYKVELSKDYGMAEIYVSVLGSDVDKKKSLQALISAKGFIRFQLGKGLQLRTVPDVKFILDDTLEKGTDLVHLIEEANKGTSKDEDSEE